MWFKAIPSLKINLEKSELIPICKVDNVEYLAAELVCHVGNLLATYPRSSFGRLFQSGFSVG